MRKTVSRAGAPAAFALAILLAYSRRRIDVRDALRKADLAPDALRDPAGRIHVRQLEALSSHAMRELDDEALGWFSRRLPWGSYGMLCRASLTAPTLAIALRRWCRHHGLLTEDVTIGLELEDGTAVVRIRENVDLGALREFCLVSLLRNLHGISCWLVDSRIPLINAQFPFAAPGHGEAYGRMFGCETAFDAPEAGIELDAGYLQLPVVRDDAALRRLLQQPITLMARQYRQDRMLSRRTVRFLADHVGHSPGTAAVAAHLNISVRSLQRHLRGEGTSLLTLKSEARRQRAEDLLLRAGDLPMKRVARLVGYGDESSFGRAFRSWTGQSPADFRRDASALPRGSSPKPSP